MSAEESPEDLDGMMRRLGDKRKAEIAMAYGALSSFVLPFYRAVVADGATPAESVALVSAFITAMLARPGDEPGEVGP